MHIYNSSIVHIALLTDGTPTLDQYLGQMTTILERHLVVRRNSACIYKASLLAVTLLMLLYLMLGNSTSVARNGKTFEVSLLMDPIGLVVSVCASRTVGREFASRPGHTKDHHKNGTNCLPVYHAMR